MACRAVNNFRKLVTESATPTSNSNIHPKFDFDIAKNDDRMLKDLIAIR